MQNRKHYIYKKQFLVTSMKGKIFLAVLVVIFLMSLVPAPHLSQVSWNMTEVAEEQPVRLNVVGVGLNGYEVSFQIFERDAGGTDDPILSPPENIIYSPSTQYTTWIAEYQDDTDEGQTNPPEYYFIATVVSTGASMRSSIIDADMLKVSKEDEDCDLTSGFWNITEALEGQPVRLNLEGTNCNGETITFEVREDDFLSSDFVGNPANIVFGSPNNYGTWIAEWQDDTDGFQTNPPEYYFIATVQRTSESITSPRDYYNMLKVTSIIQCIGLNYCPQYVTEYSCEYDICNVGYFSVPSSIFCGETVNLTTGCNDSTSCECSWNDDLDVCESAWNSKLVCPTTIFAIGDCSYTENNKDSCEDDGTFTRSLNSSWTWASGNEITQYDPLLKQLRCVDIKDVIACPNSAQIPFFGIYQIIIVTTIIFLVYVGYSIWNRKKDL